MIQGFISNERILDEHCRDDDLVGFGEMKARFTKKIDTLEGSYIIALVGPYGTGKSTMLNQIRKEKDELWVEFDAWKYPDRKDLWEGFVLDLAKEISPKEFNDALKKLEGKQNDDKKTLIKTFSQIPIPGFAVIENLNHFLDTSPARRVNDIHKILKEMISNFNKKIIVIVEDIDRSGDAGVFFLETLKQFTSELDGGINFVAIIPMANENYYYNLSSYLKCIDYFEFFDMGEIKLSKFVEDVFDRNLFEGEFKNNRNEVRWVGRHRKMQTIGFLEGLFHEMPEMTMRLLKLILRKANLIYKNQIMDGHDPDFRVTLCIEASKYFNKNADNNESFYSDFKRKEYISRGNIFSSFLFSMVSNREDLYTLSRQSNKKERINSTLDFKLFERNENNREGYPSYPWQTGMFEEDRCFGLASFYFNY